MLYTTNLVVYVYHNVRRVLSGKGVKRSRMGGAQEGEQEKSPPLSIMRLRFVFEILSCSVKEIFLLHIRFNVYFHRHNLFFIYRLLMWTAVNLQLQNLI